MSSSIAYTICHNQGSDDMSTQVVAVTQVGDSEMLYDFVECEKNKWINQLVAKFRILYTSLVDFQSSQLPSLLLVLNPESLDQQSIVNQIQVSVFASQPSDVISYLSLSLDING